MSDNENQNGNSNSGDHNAALSAEFIGSNDGIGQPDPVSLGGTFSMGYDPNYMYVGAFEPSYSGGSAGDQVDSLSGLTQAQAVTWTTLAAGTIIAARLPV